MAARATLEGDFERIQSKRVIWAFWKIALSGIWEGLILSLQGWPRRSRERSADRICGKPIRDLEDLVTRDESGQLFIGGTMDVEPITAETVPALPGIHLMRVEAPAGARMATHTHRAHEIIYVVSGRMEVATVDGVDRILETGDHMHLAPGQGHAVHWQKPTLMSVVTVPPTREYNGRAG